MKKLNLSGKDIRRLGVKDEQVIRIAKKTLMEHYKNLSKKDALSLLKKILHHPSKFANHPELGKIVSELPRNSHQQEKEPELQHIKPYNIFGKEYIEKGALDQMETAMRLPVITHGALMPDAHQGYGLPIGGVVATKNEVIPYGVGMDIGCRMAMSVFSISPEKINRDSKKLMKILNQNTRFGRAEFKEKKDYEVMDSEVFKDYPFMKSIQKKAYDQLGTSGHGNHFVDIGILEILEDHHKLNLAPGKYFAILSHSGSRGAGAEIARHYTQIAKNKCSLPKGAKPLAWLEMDKEEGIEYWAAMNWAGKYSETNHRIIHSKLAAALGEEPIIKIENHHNFAWKEKSASGDEYIVHRKGATPAREGVLGIIPGSMASPAYIVVGKGNEDSLYSAAHGAGRKLSRGEAKRRFTKKELHEYLNTRNVVLIGGGIDESPLAYKDINKVMQLQSEMVDKLAIFHPLIVKMGS
jgi:tRNA-splicing ligase RtcB